MKNIRVRIHKSLYSNFIAFRRKETNPSGVEIVSKSMSVPEQAKKEADSFCQRYQEILQDEVGQALERIPEENRTVILLTDMQGFSSKEAAKILKCSMSTLWSRLSVARKKLHGFLNLSN
ncbi:MAG: RNA polymerase sigma factor [bacterium]